MSSFYKKLITIFTFLLLTVLQISAETTSHIEHISTWSGTSMAQEINEKLHIAQVLAYYDSKYFELVELCVDSQYGYAYIIYTLSDRMDETNPFTTKVAFATAWTSEGLTYAIQDEINSLQDFALNENKIINLIDVKIPYMHCWGCGFIIYEISK